MSRTAILEYHPLLFVQKKNGQRPNRMSKIFGKSEFGNEKRTVMRGKLLKVDQKAWQSLTKK